MPKGRFSRSSLREALNRAKERILGSSRVLVVGHMDADGVSATAIAMRTLEKLGIEREYVIVKDLGAEVLASLKSKGVLIWFVDIGASWLPELRGLRYVITDHHPPRMPEMPVHVRKDIMEFAEFTVDYYEGAVLPDWYGFSGSYEISGAGTTYLLSRSLIGVDGYLASMGVVGSLGDLQDEATGRLEGLNREVLGDALETGFMEASLDLRSFGRSSRPAIQYLRYVSDPVIPGISQCRECVERLLQEEGLDPSKFRSRSWEEIPLEEKRRVVSRIVRMLLHSGLEYSEVYRIVGEVYTLVREEEKMLRDAKEFATILNACVRQGRSDIAVEVAGGERGASLLIAKEVVKDYRRSVFDSLRIVERTLGISRRGPVAFFHAGPFVPDSIVGVVTSILMSRYGGSIPILVGMADSGDSVKASIRISKKIKAAGLDIGEAVSRAAASAGGYGGGHRVAAGATIPKGAESSFLEALSSIVDELLNKKSKL